ncbi:hypothetical protein UFOVP257_435 [uncultured Caudovirales phage]|uniref:Uncharacterized protein n=1 Tax=uncultured Caudovirales phage TaxID=2100421 RepID=A0A6J5LK51_9CAUD|nr:hypothetical protein UFOVP257_435 [uncultured Caudovirales phage]
MTYFLNKTDGTAIEVLDGTSNVTATSLTLIGKLATNYGESQNENFLWLLEHFALATPPAYPTKGQLWYDTSINNIKSYDGSTWTIVGSNIVGNVRLTGNLFVGSNSFTIRDLGNVSLINQTSNANTTIISNVAGALTNSLRINGTSGEVEVFANASTGSGITTKAYVDSRVDSSSEGANIALAANVDTINANLTIRVNQENSLLAKITAANAQIDLRDTITRVNTINSDLSSSIQNNVSIINAEILAAFVSIADIYPVITAANVTHASNVTAANSAIVTANVGMKAYVDDGIGALNSGLGGLNFKANINSPAFTGIPTVSGLIPLHDNTARLATTTFVMQETAYWDGSKKFVSTTDPSSSDGNNGDIWFKYI